MRTIILALAVVLFLVSCNNSNKVSYAKNDINIDVKKDQDSIHSGKKLMETYCYACHDARTSEDKRLAPPMIAVKRHYISRNTSKEEFIVNIQNWIANPNEKDAKMYGAIKRFGVMQKMPYPDDVIKEIADYIYDYEIEQPEWFQEHQKLMGERMRLKNN
ncbi:hypothetical protein [Algibacter aquimarinus]|uniref:Cytochrome c domain-containing protein n=1 Tax=Algibacter aquimarinus TaxID=1136748 RepID=A0ABP9HRM9_9FLAO